MRSKTQSVINEATKYFYNLSDKQLERNVKGGKSARGRTLSDEACINISNGQKGKPKSKSHKQKISKTLLGRELPLETKQKMSESRIGLKHSKETIKKLKKSAQKRCTPISQFDLDGNLIKDWIGFKEAANFFNMKNGRAIQLVCNYYRDNLTKGSKQCKGFIWKYKN